MIAALNGLVIGGGFEVALGCDLLIAADHVEFALPEMPLGIVPHAGALQRLPRRIPHNIAMEMLLLGRRMTAQEAAHYGLVNKVVPKENLMEAAREWPMPSQVPRLWPCKASKKYCGQSNANRWKRRLKDAR